MPLLLEAPDLEAIAATKLRDAAIPNLQGVHSSIPKSPTYPLVTVKRIGGLTPVREYMDAGNIQIEVWGGTKTQARDIAARARVELFELAGTTVTSPVTAWISAVEDSLSLTWQPDPLTARDRYIFSVLIYGRSL